MLQKTEEMLQKEKKCYRKYINHSSMNWIKDPIEPSKPTIPGIDPRTQEDQLDYYHSLVPPEEVERLRGYRLPDNTLLEEVQRLYKVRSEMIMREMIYDHGRKQS